MFETFFWVRFLEIKLGLLKPWACLTPDYFHGLLEQLATRSLVPEMVI